MFPNEIIGLILRQSVASKRRDSEAVRSQSDFQFQSRTIVLTQIKQFTFISKGLRGLARVYWYQWEVASGRDNAGNERFELFSYSVGWSCRRGGAERLLNLFERILLGWNAGLLPIIINML